MYDTIIIGCGPAGITAAIYLRRANKNIAIIDKESIGGQMAKSPLVENYPGFYGSGNELADIMFKPIEQDIDFYFGEVIYMNYDKDHYIIKTDAAVLEAKTVIWATGCEPIKLNVEGENLDHIHYCVTCDGPLYKDKEVLVIGDANSALQYALELSTYCKEVTIMTLFNKFFAEDKLIDRVMNNKKIKWLPNCKTKAFKEEENEVIIVVEANARTYEMPSDGVFVAIGQKPHNQLLSMLDIQLSENGYVMPQNDNLCVKEGFYVAGDCRLKDFRQITTAVADGTVAALNVIDYLNNKKEL